MKNLIKIYKKTVKQMTNNSKEILFSNLYEFDKYGEYFEDLSDDIELASKLLIQFKKENDEDFIDKFLTCVDHDADFSESFFADAIFRIFLKKENVENEIKEALEDFTESLRENYINYLENFEMEEN